MCKQKSKALCRCGILSLRRKRGFGIIEVMVAALVLGILYAAISNLQKGNRDALLRIRGRDGATEVAQNIIDEMNAQGLASFTDDKLIPCTDASGATIADCFTLAKPGEDGTGMVKDLKTVTRTWKGQPGLVPNTMTVPYTVEVNFSKDDDYKATADSKLLETTGGSSSSGVKHIFAKRVDVIVSWPFKNSTQSIKVSGVIR
jgi:prepilin-type N-terminal cleavage/methylation domain-containing protein